uniref:LRRCT domain-containing protein n=1 Tax=Caenorhabditis tropicalis TaxID=1561998 RepID=A0A1I7TL87_9PELO
MDWKPVLLVLLALAALGSASFVPCLNGCKCDVDVSDPVICCDFLQLNYFPLPITLPHKSYNFLALSCNLLETVPSYDLIKQAFPDLHGIDLQGNPNLNCSSLAQFSGKLAVLSDCDSPKPTECVAPQIISVTYPTTPAPAREKTFEYPKCDRTCKDILRLQKIWRDIRNMANSVNPDKILNKMGEHLREILGY